MIGSFKLSDSFGMGLAQSCGLSWVSAGAGLIESSALFISHRRSYRNSCIPSGKKHPVVGAGEGKTIFKYFFFLLVPLGDFVPLLIQVIN